MARLQEIPAYLDRPIYSFSEADHLAAVSRGTARRWLCGYAYSCRDGERVAPPAVTPGAERQPAVSFVDLVELVAIARLKERGFSLSTIREIVRNCQELLGVPRPLASLRLKTGGREVFVGVSDRLLEVGRKKGMQAWSEILEPYLQDLEYTNEIASRWWPLGKKQRVVVDPDYGFGLPVVSGSGVRTEIILERFQAGDLPAEIARDFNLSTTEVERALQFELKRLKRAA